MPHPPVFTTTLWTEIARARDRDPAALERFLRRYRPAVVAWLRCRGRQEADAEDLAQLAFQRLLDRDLLAKAERDKGRFRALLLGIVRNVAREESRREHAAKRGGGVAHVPLEAAEVAADSPAPGEEERFDRVWVGHLVEQALVAVRDGDRARGTRYVELLRAAALEGLGYAALAERFGLQVHDVKNGLHRARTRVAAQLRRLVRGYASSAEEYAAELEFFERFLVREAGEARPPASGGD